MNRHLKHILYISIWTFVVVVCWVVFLVISERITPAVSQETLMLAEELDPQFDQSAFSELRDRSEIPVDLTESVILSEVEEGTNEAELEVSPSLPEDL